LSYKTSQFLQQNSVRTSFCPFTTCTYDSIS